MATKFNIDYNHLGFKNDKPIFKTIYLKETPKEVLNFLIKDYHIKTYLDICTNWMFPSKSNGFYGIIIQESDFQEDISIGKSMNSLDMSFFKKLASKEKRSEDIVKSLIKSYLIISYNKKRPNFIIKKHSKSFDEEIITNNYFKDRKNEKDEIKEKKLSQILEYSQAIFNNPKFLLKDLENLIL